MNPSILVSESTLTNRYQTTVPGPIRKALGLKKSEKIRYTIQANGDVLLSRVDDDEDPVLNQFLAFLAQDIADNPSQMSTVGSDLANRIQTLVADVDVDLDAPLSDEDE